MTKEARANVMRTRSDERGFWERPAVMGRDQENMGAKGRGKMYWWGERWEMGAAGEAAGKIARGARKLAGKM